jgi:Na+:H+ antiporter, NhaA family
MRRAWRFMVDHYLVVPIGGTVALVWANTDPVRYFQVAHALAFSINDVGMALVFGYLAQEVVEAALPGGTLYPFRRALVPVLGGIGGAIGAALVYLGYLRTGDEQVLSRGWPISCPADALVAVAAARVMFGRNAAVSVTLTMALTTNVLGLAAISPHHLVAEVHPMAATLIAVGVGLAMILRRRRVTSSWPYVVVAGSLSWLGCYWAGIQPQLALLPIVPFLRHSPRDLTMPGERIEHLSAAHFESVMAVPVQVIALLFAFVNIGVVWRGFGTGTWAVMTSSLVGRPLGMLGALAVASLAGLHLPGGLGWKHAFVAALAATPSLVFGVFAAVSVFPVGPLLDQTKLGAVATAAGLLPAFAAARILGVGRFAADPVLTRRAPPDTQDRSPGTVAGPGGSHAPDGTELRRTDA